MGARDGCAKPLVSDRRPIVRLSLFQGPNGSVHYRLWRIELRVAERQRNHVGALRRQRGRPIGHPKGIGALARDPGCHRTEEYAQPLFPREVQSTGSGSAPARLAYGRRYAIR